METETTKIKRLRLTSPRFGKRSKRTGGSLLSELRWSDWDTK